MKKFQINCVDLPQSVIRKLKYRSNLIERHLTSKSARSHLHDNFSYVMHTRMIIWNSSLFSIPPSITVAIVSTPPVSYQFYKKIRTFCLLDHQGNQTILWDHCRPNFGGFLKMLHIFALHVKAQWFCPRIFVRCYVIDFGKLWYVQINF